MLVLSRKQNESIRIGDDIEIVIIRIGPNKVGLGIVAPPTTNIRREELVPLQLAIAGDDPPPRAA